MHCTTAPEGLTSLSSTAHWCQLLVQALVPLAGHWLLWWALCPQVAAPPSSFLSCAALEVI